MWPSELLRIERVQVGEGCMTELEARESRVAVWATANGPSPQRPCRSSDGKKASEAAD